MEDNARHEQQRAAAALGREAARQALAGRSPHKVGRERVVEALCIVYAWGCSAPRLLDEHLYKGRSGFAARLVKQGLLHSHPLPGLGRYLDLPASVVTLTPAAVELVEATLEAPIGYDQAHAIAHHQLRHDLWVQRVVLKRIREKKADSYMAPRHLAAKSELGRKQPDAVWVVGGDAYAYELELTQKTGREFDQTCEAIARSLKERRFSGVRIDTPLKAIFHKYKEAFKIGNSIPVWERDKNKHWSKKNGDRIMVSSDLAESIAINLISRDWMK